MSQRHFQEFTLEFYFLIYSCFLRLDPISPARSHTNEDEEEK